MPELQENEPRSGRAERTPADVSILLLGQWFGCGLSPLGPGTVGSLGALPLYFLLRESVWVYWAAAGLTCLAGVFISQRCSELLGEKDPSSVVIDEVAGVLLALGPVMHLAWPYAAAAWVLFRVLDISKPWLIDRAQYLPPAGLGIMADDILAGAVAGGATWTVALLIG